MSADSSNDESDGNFSEYMPEYQTMISILNAIGLATVQVSMQLEAMTQAQNQLAQIIRQTASHSNALQSSLSGVSGILSTLSSVGNTLVTTYNSILTIQNQLINMNMGYVDQQVQLYDAQINAIQQQNMYTQALALNAFAVQATGRYSSEALSTQIALNYNLALYNQALKNQTVAATGLQYAWLNTFGTIIQAAMAPAQAAVKTASGFATIAGAQGGGTVQESGLAVIHKGEEVVTAELVDALKGLRGAGGNAPISMQFNISGSSSPVATAKSIVSEIEKQFATLFRTRGSY